MWQIILVLLPYLKGNEYFYLLSTLIKCLSSKDINHVCITMFHPFSHVHPLYKIDRISNFAFHFTCFIFFLLIYISIIRSCNIYCI
jgi:hypothetical protein